MTDDKSVQTIDKQIVTTQKTISSLFKKKTPPHAIKLRKGAGGRMFPYVKIDYTIAELDRAFGIFWEFIVDNVEKTPAQIIVRGKLTVKSPGGFSISRPGVGRANIKFYTGTKTSVDEGNDEKAATSDAIKKAASLFGIAADVYYKEIDKYEEVPQEIDQEEEMHGKAMAKFFAVAKDRGFDSETAKARIKEIWKVKHMADITSVQIERTTNKIEVNYQVVEPGESPLKTGEKRAAAEEVAEEVIDVPAEAPQTSPAAPETPEVVKGEEVPEEKKGTYVCQGPKHKETGIDVEVPVGTWCTKQCQDAYYGEDQPKKKYPWEK